MSGTLIMHVEKGAGVLKEKASNLFPAVSQVALGVIVKQNKSFWDIFRACYHNSP